MPINRDQNHKRDPVVVAVIPAYNEEGNISRVVLQARKFVDKVIVCDDGSIDNTGEIAEAQGATVVRHPRNLGYGAALSTLFKEARKLNPDIMVTIDADGQHDPRHIPRLIDPIASNSTDVVIGSRFLSEGAGQNLPAYRRVGIGLISRLAKRASYDGLTDAQSGFRAYNKRALKAIRPTEHGMGASTEILIKAKQANLAIKEVPVTISYGKETSSRNPITQAAQVILSTLRIVSTRRPQIFYGVPSALALLIALGLWIHAAQTYTIGGQLPAESTLLAMGVLIVGIVLLIVATMLWMALNVAKEIQTEREQAESRSQTPHKKTHKERTGNR